MVKTVGIRMGLAGLGFLCGYMWAVARWAETVGLRGEALVSVAVSGALVTGVVYIFALSAWTMVSGRREVVPLGKRHARSIAAARSSDLTAALVTLGSFGVGAGGIGLVLRLLA